jgi:arsenate reductase
MTDHLNRTIEFLLQVDISADRKAILKPLILYIARYDRDYKTAQLNFICTHNSRRSQMAQAWAQVAADYFDVPAKCFSGGVEVTAFNTNAITALRDLGFELSVDSGANPVVSIATAANKTPLQMFSKLYDDEINPTKNFAAVMTCSHADENCPIILGAEERFSITYEDPKIFDHAPQQDKMYLERGIQIGNEMLYVFAQVVKKRAS